MAKRSQNPIPFHQRSSTIAVVCTIGVFAVTGLTVFLTEAPTYEEVEYYAGPYAAPAAGGTAMPDGVADTFGPGMGDMDPAEVLDASDATALTGPLMEPDVVPSTDG